MALHPRSDRKLVAEMSSLPLPGVSSLRVKRQVRYLRISPMTITFAMKGMTARI